LFSLLLCEQKKIEEIFESLKEMLIEGGDRERKREKKEDVRRGSADEVK